MIDGLAERGILIVENDAAPFNDHYPFHGLTPITEQYAVLPIRDGFNWAERLRDVAEGQWYLVVFRSVRRATADVDVLTEFDDHAHTEALDAGGLMYYFRGELGGDRECLSFCLWKTQEQAKAALRLPRHQAAVRVAREMYESYLLERYILTKHRESTEIKFQHLS